MFSKRCTWIFYIVFSLIFIPIVTNIIINNPYHKTLWLLFGLIAVLAVFARIYKFLDKKKALAWSERNYKKIIWIFATIMCMFQIIFGIVLRSNPLFDVGAIHHGAIEWVNTGDFKSYHEYFYYFPNNLGSMSFLFVIYKLSSLIGITDFYAVAVVINSIMITATMLIASLICREMFGIKQAVFVCILYVFSVQFYFMGGAIYTDCLSMLFPILLLYLYIKSGKQQERKQRIITYLIMGFVAAIGSSIKFTVIIMVIAIMIHMLLTRKPKELLSPAICIISIIVAFNVSFNTFMYSTHMDKQQAKLNNTPYIHWIMMGLSGNSGKYNPSDYNFTRSLNIDERDIQIKKEIERRINEKGMAGMFTHLLTKGTNDFGDGTYGIADLLGCDPQTDTSLHKWVLYDGEYYSKYTHYATSVHIAILILTITLAIFYAKNNNKQRENMLPVFVAIFGVLLFLLAWECNRRYFSNFAHIFFIAAAGGIEPFVNNLKIVKQSYVHGIK